MCELFSGVRSHCRKESAVNALDVRELWLPVWPSFACAPLHPRGQQPHVA